MPEEFEFWESGEYGLDERVRFRKPAKNEDSSSLNISKNGWIKEKIL